MTKKLAGKIALVAGRARAVGAPIARQLRVDGGTGSARILEPRLSGTCGEPAEIAAAVVGLSIPGASLITAATRNHGSARA